jgi:hypothetical protein
MARLQRAQCSVLHAHDATHTPLLAAVKSVVLVLLCAPLACPLSPPAVSKYSIVTSNPTAEETYAAEQLQHWLERACGCTVPITDARAEVPSASPQLAVGYTAALALVTAAGGPSLNTSGLGQEGFVVWGDDSTFSLAVTGGESAPRCVSPCAPTVCLPRSLPASLAACHPGYLPACTHACLSTCLYVDLPACLPVNLPFWSYIFFMTRVSLLLHARVLASLAFSNEICLLTLEIFFWCFAHAAGASTESTVCWSVWGLGFGTPMQRPCQC